MTTILALVGSLRADSINRKIAEAAPAWAPEGVTVTVYPTLGDVPFYNEDIDVAGSVPEAAAQLREAVSAADAVLLVTPEYNGSLPAVAKNALDWLSRPYGNSVLKGLPFGVVAASAAAWAGKWTRTDAHRVATIAGGAPLAEDAHFGIAIGDLAEKAPQDVPAVAEGVKAVLAALADDAKAAAASDESASA